jgi:uncharacterized phage protein gp47/JayE
MTLQELKDRIYNDIVTNFKNAITPLKKSFFETLSYALSSAFKLLYVYLDKIQADSFLTTCTKSRVLNYFAPLKNLKLKEATSSEGTVRFTGLDGSIIPIDTVILYNEYEYITTESGTIGDVTTGLVDINCKSVETGTLYNTIANITLVLAFPIDGVDNNVFSSGGFTGAIDDETVESLRTRTRQKFASPTNIDNNFFYKSLASEVDGVKASFVSELKNGVGTTGITILTFSNNGVPIQADLDKVEQNFIDTGSIPTYANFEFFIPTIISKDFTIQLIINDETNQNNIEQLIRDYLYLFVEPGTTFLYKDLADLLQSNGARLVSPLTTDTEVLASDEVIDIGTITWQ